MWLKVRGEGKVSGSPGAAELYTLVSKSGREDNRGRSSGRCTEYERAKSMMSSMEDFRGRRGGSRYCFRAVRV